MPKVKVELDGDVALLIAALLIATAEHTDDPEVAALTVIYKDAAHKAVADQLSYEEVVRITSRP